MKCSTQRAAICAVILAFALPAVSASAKSTTQVYDSFSSDGADYSAKWAAGFGPGEGTTTFTGEKFNIADTPFHAGADFSVFDHLKYLRTSTTAFPVPRV